MATGCGLLQCGPSHYTPTPPQQPLDCLYLSNDNSVTSLGPSGILFNRLQSPLTSLQFFKPLSSIYESLSRHLVFYRLLQGIAINMPEVSKERHVDFTFKLANVLEKSPVLTL